MTDLKGNLLKEITVAGESANMSPRQLAKVDGKVYVSFMEGYVEPEATKRQKSS